MLDEAGERRSTELRTAVGRRTSPGLARGMTDQGRPLASPPVPIGPSRPSDASGAGVAFGQLPNGPAAAHPPQGGPAVELTSPAAALAAQPGSMPRSESTDPLGVSGSSGAPSPQSESAAAPAPSRTAAMHPGWQLPPIAPRAHRRGASSDASTLGPDPSRHGAGAAAAALMASSGVHGAAETRVSSSDGRRSGGSGVARQRAAPPPTAASLVKAEEREDRLRRGQSLLVDEAHSMGGIAQVGEVEV